MTATAEGDCSPGKEQRRSASRHPQPVRAQLDVGKPDNAGSEERGCDVKVQAKPKDVVSGIDPQELLADATQGVAGDVEGEQPRCTNAAVLSEPHQDACEAEVPDQLIEEGRVEGGKLLIPGRAVSRVDLERPRQVRRAAKELLVEVVADPPDRLGDE
jgi:hypothetical protein